MSDVIKQHMTACGCYQPVLDFSLDGVQECKSSSQSLDIYSVSFKNCKTVYPIKVLRPVNKFKIDNQNHLKNVIDDINLNGCKINAAIFDNLKRSVVRCALGHGASYACEYCESKAEFVYMTGADQGKRGQLAWPFSTYGGPQRTQEKIIEITEKIRNGENLSREGAKGFYGTSHLLYQNDFHFINDIPAEYMHSGCIGVVKRLVELTFNVGETRTRVTKRKLSDVAEFNRLIMSAQVTYEFSRRLRHLDFGVFKAQEYRNLVLFFFPFILECIPDEFTKEKKVWLQLAYILRSCVLPNKEFELISKTLIQRTGCSFYKNYESLYGKKNCTYSVHLIASHLLQIRGNQPLTERSAFKFENFYSEMKNLFQPGTTSTTKQIMTNCFMKRKIENHNCVKSIKYDVEKKGKENNSIIYYMDENNVFKFYNIIKVNPDGTFLCNPQGRYNFVSDIAKELDWEKVGVFKVGPYSDEEVIIPKEKIEGKVLRVLDFFITCPNNVLREQ